ncbi:THP1-like protein [Saccharomyces kudriavzevii IFO 1802]|uniref:THP1-like protein n=1 Tax=Saccharomyces kudriavzevii (strain ATCC MYA-4449 / AS 2.2408 / CBS 8840 / NBRC 1802 / NCYC 2889) TaxID=226230 RepID=J5PJJ3_SACK1|nr:THP1-like protein [Saccharomyces kudriavzevii IFO 1802]
MAMDKANQLLEQLGHGNFTLLTLNLSQNGPEVAILQQQLTGSDDGHLEALVEQHAAMPNDTRFKMMCTSYLKYARDVDPWSLWSSSDLIFEFYQCLINCLINDSAPHIDALIPVATRETEFVIVLADKLDAFHLQLHTRDHQFLSHISSILSRLFNSTKPPRGNASSEDIPGKQQILLYLVNKLNNIYFRIESPQLCSNIFKNFQPKSMFAHFSEYRIDQQIEYRYLLGRYYLLNSQVQNAFVQFNEAFQSLLSLPLTNRATIRNGSRILNYMIPTGLVLGKMVRWEPLRPFVAQETIDTWNTLYRYVRFGNVQGVNLWLRHNERHLCARQLLIVLLEKLPMITYRNLIKTVITIWTTEWGQNKLPYPLIERALQLSIGQAYEDPTVREITIYNGIHSSKNVENVLVTLTNLGFLRANCFPQLQLCVVKKTTMIQEIVPPVSERIIKMFPAQSRVLW